MIKATKLSELDIFLKNNEVKAFIDNINTISRGKKHKKLSTLLGVNIDSNKIISVKLYFEIYRLFLKSEIIKFLPTSEDFFRYQLYWNKSIDSSLCFGIKKINNEIIRYFHIKLDPCFNKKFTKDFTPKFLKQSFNDNNHIGISYEYGKKQTKIKRYYYLKDDKSINDFFVNYNINPDNLIDLDHIEYTEFDTESKYILVKKFNANKQHIYKEVKTAVQENNCIDLIKKELNLDPCFYGKYNDAAITSVYFSLTRTGLALPDYNINII